MSEGSTNVPTDKPFEWHCAGCGAPGIERSCDCVTDVICRCIDGKHEHKVKLTNKRPRFGIPQNAAERAAHRWLTEHSGDEGENVMQSLAQAMRRYAEHRFGKLSVSEPHDGNEEGKFPPGSCARCGQFHSTAACQPIDDDDNGQFGVGA